MKTLSICYILMFMFLLPTMGSTEVCKFAYKGQPEDFHDSTIVVPDNMVAMSEDFYVGTPKDSTVSTISKPTIMFVIDHSGSMSVSNNPKDVWGNRFNVTRDLIDTLHKKYPNAEVGISVFRGNLYFKKQDAPDVFAECPAQDSGAYIKLFQLNKEYDGKKGYEILKKYLRTDTVTQGINTFVDLTYKPTGGWFDDDGGYTHINAGFDASKHAMEKSKYPKSNHFVIFLSDGAATFPNDGTQNEYIQGTGVPTTFTVFFTNSTNPPNSLRTMTENIKNNGYSVTNPQSNLWAYKNTHYDSLMNFLMKNVISQITANVLNTPTEIKIKNNTVTNWDKKKFSFDKMFALEGEKTQFKFDIKYHVKMDTINENGEIVTIEKDKSVNVNFDVKIDENAKQLPDTFLVQCWDRKIEFFHESQKIKIGTELTRDIDLRFIEKKIDILYGYDNVSIDISSMKTKDKEKIKLDVTGNYLSKIFRTQVKKDAMSGDGILQLEHVDTIIAFFKNKDLPLDTFTAKLPFVYNKLDFILMPQALAPIKIGDIIADKGLEIPKSIFSILSKDNQEEFKDKKSGMLIQVVPTSEDMKKILNSGLELQGKISIFDGLGNTIILRRDMGYDEKNKTLNFLWNCKNLQTRYISNGSYLARFEVTSKDHPKMEWVETHDPLKLMLGISK